MNHLYVYKFNFELLTIINNSENDFTANRIILHHISFIYNCYVSIENLIESANTSTYLDIFVDHNLLKFRL